MPPRPRRSGIADQPLPESPLPPADSNDRLRSVRRLVGGTPLLAIDLRLDGGEERRIYAKAEHLNLTGSIKDRSALEVVRHALEDGALADESSLLVAADGHAAVSFSAIGSAIGRRVSVVMPEDANPAHMLLARSYGADLHLAPRDAVGALATDLAAASPGTFRVDPLGTADQTAAHARTTAPELWAQLMGDHAVPDAFVTGIGSGGTMRGIGQVLRREVPSLRVHQAVAADGREVPGWRRADGAEPATLPYGDGPVAVAVGDAILMAQKMARELGLGVGISSGANLLAALEVQDALGPEAVVVTVLCDTNRAYLDGPLMRDEPVRAGYRTPRLTFRGFRALNRSCTTCVDPTDRQSFPGGIFEMARRLERRQGRASPAA
ncbi:MAG: hypothetical protein RL139_1076 [Gemmatimonadota bacterium]|jgi:cysteine synthase